MLQVKREQTFETNSSSMHSLSILNTKDSVETIVAKLDNLDSLHYTINVGEFGWETKRYKQPLQILRYLWTYITHYKPEYKDKIKEYMPCTYFVEPKFNETYSLPDEGYIDHGGEYRYLEEIFKSKELFAGAIINGVVSTTNDNIDVEDNWLEPKNASKIYYKYN